MTALLALLLAADAVCPAQTLKAARFTPGEELTYALDVLGADVGTFDLQLAPAPADERPRAALLIRARAHTNTFVATNVKKYESFATALVGRDLAPLRYHEEVEDGDTHRAQDFAFPAGGGALAVPATKN